MPKVTKKSNPLLDNEEKKTKASEVESDKVENEIETDETEDEAPVKEPVKVKAPAPVSDKDIARSMKSDIELTREALSKEEQVNFMIPLSEGEKAGATHEVFINGYKIIVPKGRMAILPKSVVNLLSESYRVAAEVGAEFRLDLDDDKYKNLN